VFKIRMTALAIVLLVVAPPVARPGIGAVNANVCTTQWGWCLLTPGTIIPTGRPCRCYTLAGQPVDGRSHSFDYSQLLSINPSPYLNPHADPPHRPGSMP
jgi:hypothetical protein